MTIAGNLRLYLSGLVLVGLCGGGVLLLAKGRERAEESEGERRHAEVAAGPHILTGTVAAAATERRLALQGEARPFAEVTLYAKFSGYLKSILVDKGDVVRAGQLLGTIEAPELDRQYDAARADAKFKRDSAGRTVALAKSGFVAPRDAELDSSQAVMSEANLALLGSQRGYMQLRAPFAGTITARYADAGALLQSAANSQTTAMPVVTISDLDRLRIYCYVDQRDAAQVKVGDPVEIELAGASPVAATLTRLASELDPRTRTMLVEVDLPNRERTIVAGSFVTVRLTVKSPPGLEVPVEALVVRGKQTLVARVEPNQRLHFVPVVVQSHDGARLRVSGELSLGTVLALNIADSLVEGALIQPVGSSLPPAAGAAH